MITQQLSISTLDLVECLSMAMDLISPSLANHQRRVAHNALQIAREIKLSASDQKEIFVGALLHDCGALAMPGRLNTLRFDLYDGSPFDPTSHAVAGYHLTKQFRHFADLADIIRFHHHPWARGNGALHHDQEVPIGAHIIHLADRLDVLIVRDSHILLQKKKIMEQIDAMNHTLFHPVLVEALHDMAVKESFWLDITSLAMGPLLAQDIGLADENLNCDDLLEMTVLFGHIIDFRSRFTATHSYGVAITASALARLAGFTEFQCMMMKIAGNLHDLGKLAVPLEILDKPGKLTEDEFDIVKAHTYYTHRILKNFKELDEVRQWAAFHHEKLDGSGYPFRHAGQALSKGSRLMAVADVFTAITEDRPYRKGMQLDEATRVLLDMGEQQALDQVVVQMLLDNLDEINKIRIMAQTESLTVYQDFAKSLSE